MSTCYEMLLDGANRKGFVDYYNHKIAIAQILADIEDFSGALNSLGLVKGDVVTLYLPTCPQSLVAFYACSKLGLVANVIHPLVPVNLLRENLAKTGSKVLLFYDATVKDERPLLSLNQLLVRCSIADYVTVRKPLYKLYSVLSGKRQKDVATYRGLLQKGRGIPTQVVGAAGDTICYMHSGGTSGQPKIVKLTNSNFNACVEAMFDMYHPTVHQDDWNLATLPVFHAYGLCSAMHGPLSVGYNLILVPKFSPKVVEHYFKKYRVTVWSVVPAMLKKMLAERRFDGKYLRNLDVIWCGGDVCDETLVERVDAILSKYCERARLMRGYGLTEVCGVCVVNNYDNYRKVSCGKPMPGYSVEIWDDDGNAVARGELGEVAINGGGVMQGYLEGDDCTVERNGKTWVKTGDVGKLDDDGFLYIVDRKKRSLKIAAVNVFPAQIEDVVKQLDFVAEACAVGVKVDGKQFVKVFVTLNKPLERDSVTKQVIDHCKANLIGYAVPRFVEILDAMPRTPLGKIDYKKLSDL